MAKGPAERGFSLLELVVVLAILALSALVIVPNLGRTAEGLENRVFRDGVVAFVREAQREADRSGYPCAVRYLPREHALEAAGEVMELPEGWEAFVREEEGSRTGTDGWLRIGPWRAGDRTGGDPVELMRWSAGGLSTPTDWRLREEGGGESIRVYGDLLDGVRVE